MRVCGIWPIIQSITPTSPAPGKLYPRFVQPRQAPPLPPAPTVKSWFHYGKRRLLHFSSPLPACPHVAKVLLQAKPKGLGLYSPTQLQCTVQETCLQHCHLRILGPEHLCLHSLVGGKFHTERRKVKRSKTNRIVGENRQFNNDSWRP